MTSNNASREEMCRALTSAVAELPPMPAVALRLLEITARDNASILEIESLLASDTAIAAKTLRVVNSAYYGLSAEIWSLAQAAVMLGTHQIRSLVLSLSTSQSLRLQGSLDQATLAELWTHAFASNSAAELICRFKCLDTHEAELAATGALLNRVGRLFVFSQFPKWYNDCVQLAGAENLSLDQACIQLIGISSGEVGKMLAKHWNFPDQLVQVIGIGQADIRPGDTDPVQLTVCIAAYIADTVMSNGSQDADIDEPLRMWLGLTDDGLRDLTAKTKGRLSQSQSLFGAIAA